MMLKLLFLVIVALVSVSAATPSANDPLPFQTFRPASYTPDMGQSGPLDVLMPRVDCWDAQRVRYYGTAFRINKDFVLTAAHVVDGKSCRINGQPAPITMIDVGQDYALLQSSTDQPAHFAIDCTPPEPLRWYYAQGWGGQQLQFHAWLSRGRLETGVMADVPPDWLPYHEFDGVAIHGDSGGPVINPFSGGVTAIVSARWSGPTAIPFARAMADTIFCKGVD